MNLKSQVCSLELAKRLDELSVPQSSLFYWVREKIFPEFTIQYISWFDDLDVSASLSENYEHYAAFTTAELGNMLPSNVRSQKIYHSDGWVCHVYFQSMDDNDDDIREDFIGNTEANARAAMLVWLIEQGHVNI